jgi:hypothetical protein
VSFIICSYYTLNTPYVEVAHKFLMSSLVKFPHIIKEVIGVENLGSWQANTSFKPKFLLAMLNKHPSKNILFLDCDVEINGSLDLFCNIPLEYNFAAHYLDKNKWYGKNYGKDYLDLLTGTLFIRNTVKSSQIVQKWLEKCTNCNIWEQKILQKVLVEFDEKIFNLPIEYCWIKSLPNGAKPIVQVKAPIIVHNQVSRVLKKVITKN